MKISIDTNVLLEPSDTDWFSFIFAEYSPKGTRKVLIRDILALGKKYAVLVMVESVLREFLCKKPGLGDFIRNYFQITEVDDKTHALLTEITTILSKRFNENRQRTRSQREADPTDIRIFIESWYNNCDVLLTQDGFLPLFHDYFHHVVSEIREEEDINRKNGLIESLAADIVNEERKSNLIDLIRDSLSNSIPDVRTLEEFFSELEIDVEEMTQYRDEFLVTFLREEISDESRTALVTVTKMFDEHITLKNDLEISLTQVEASKEERLEVLDQILQEKAPDIFTNYIEAPPYERILKKMFKKTKEHLHEEGILEISIEIYDTSWQIIIHHKDDLKLFHEYSGEIMDFHFDNNFIYGTDQYGAKRMEMEIDFAVLSNIRDEINKEYDEAFKRKQKERRDFWKHSKQEKWEL